MDYTIFTLEQVTPRTKAVPGPRGATQIKPNPGPPPVYPAGSCLVYEPPSLDIYADDPLLRRVLLRDPHGTATMPEILAAFPQVLDAKYSSLWQAAHEWEQRSISGVGLSILSLGVAQAKPKALAVAQWSNNLWMNHYYPRKATISLDSEPDCDFSIVGDMPYSVPEISAEVWGA